ncbi:putative CWF19-like protein 1-like [Apostichopus japonicus]|uniref:CWF19-like protein 1 n=1 Tax=Stichopus japonicus TaxID=307972 RepID=A0A2G8K2V5_STIJA|nr:putative CWF19-like protein 1-like [Apostichopus japonicus]
MLLCVGSFFSTDPEKMEVWSKYMNGEEQVPLPTYILGPTISNHVQFYRDLKGCELCENVTYLGKKGLFTGTSGLKIAYLSGLEGESPSSHQFTKSDIDALGLPLVSNSSFKGVDILLTSHWPKGVTKYAVPQERINVNSTGSSLIADLALALRPRYHFAGQEGLYYERLPYRNHRVLAENARHATRFVGLAKVGNDAKLKSLYAFNMVPMCSMTDDDLNKQPEDVTECPYSFSEKAKPADMSNQYFYSTNQQHKGQKRQSDHGQGQRKQHRKPAQPSGPCWFCLSSPEVEKHMVVSVGTHTYVAIAKGGLVPDHVLILPIGHYQSTVELSQEIVLELEQYKSSLKKYFRSVGKNCVVFERNFKTSHLQLQVVPVDDVVTEDILEEFQRLADEHDIELNQIPSLSDLKQIISVGAPYFYVELDSGEKLLHRVKKFFPLQFGREVLAGRALLNMPDRVDWKNCKSSKEEEKNMADEFRSRFKKFDPNAM